MKKTFVLLVLFAALLTGCGGIKAKVHERNASCLEHFGFDGEVSVTYYENGAIKSFQTKKCK